MDYNCFMSVPIQNQLNSAYDKYALSEHKNTDKSTRDAEAKVKDLSEALADGNLSSIEYKTLKQNYLEQKKSEGITDVQAAEKEFYQAMVSTIGKTAADKLNTGTSDAVMDLGFKELEESKKETASAKPPPENQTKLSSLTEIYELKEKLKTI